MEPLFSKRVRVIIRISGLLVIAVCAGGAIAYMRWEKGGFKKPVKVAIVTWTEDTFWDPTERGAEDAAKDLGVNLTFIKSKPDEASQTQHIKDVLSGGVDGLAISPNNPQTQQAIIDEAASKSVVITFDSDAPNTKRRGYVGTDDYAAGQIAADEVRSAIANGGKVMIVVGSIDMSNGRDRRQGLIDNLLDRPFKKGQNSDALDASLKGRKYDIISTITDHHDIGSVSKLVGAAIAAHPDVQCIVGLFSYDGPEIVKAIDAAGKKGKIKVIGFDESLEEQQDVLNGSIYSSILQDQYQCGYEIVRDLADICRGSVRSDAFFGPWLTALPVLVMRPENIQSLRDKHMIRSIDAH